MFHWSCGSMKGFIYLLEIAVASILIVVVLSTFFAIRVKQDWDSADLVGIGNNILNYIRQDNSIFLGVLNEDFTQIERIKPANVGYGLFVTGSPKTNVIVGCAQPVLCDYIDNLLTDTYVNGRSIGFDIESFNISEGIPEFIDAVVLVNYTGYSTYRSTIENYLNSGGIVVGINASYDSNDADFNYTFGLGPSSSASDFNRFSTYDPLTEDVEKYFLGIGFDTTTSYINYDSGINCFEDGYVLLNGAAGWYLGESICGLPASEGGGTYWVGTEGRTGYMIIRTPSLPQEGDYTLEFSEFRGTTDQDYEDYSVGCGGQVYYFPDNENVEQWRWKSVTCHFNPGVNEFNFTAIGGNSSDIDSFRLTLSGGSGGTTVGAWYIWEDDRKINVVSNRVSIENKTVDEGLLQNIPEGGTFRLKGPDNLWYSFKVKKIFSGDDMNIQPLNTSFVFKDFSEANDVAATNKKIIGPLGSAASMTSNGSAIWISDFPYSSEYAALVKSAILSRKDEWIAKGAYTTRETATVSSFFSLCCDMPETPELEITLWYTI
jgi:hypothetical protein